MRATGCLCALLGTLLALPPGIAEAKITPLPKPKSISAKPATSGRGSLIAPVTRPVTRTTIRPAAKLPPRPHIVSAPSAPAAPRTTAGRPVLRATSTPRRHRFVPAVISGGRERGWVVPSGGGRAESAPARAATPVPTPLAMVRAGEAMPVYAEPWPSWMIPLLTLLAAAECFVLVGLARGRLTQAGI